MNFWVIRARDARNANLSIRTLVLNVFRSSQADSPKVGSSGGSCRQAKGVLISSFVCLANVLRRVVKGVVQRHFNQFSPPSPTGDRRYSRAVLEEWSICVISLIMIRRIVEVHAGRYVL